MKLPIVLFSALALLIMSPFANANGLPADTPPDGYDNAQQPAAYPQPAPAPVPVPRPKPKEADWYAGVYGGFNWADDYGAVIGPIVIDSNTDGGAVVGVFAGKRIPSVPGLSFEVEGNYRVNDTNTTVTFIAPPPLISIPGQDSTIALMGNARYEIWQGGKVTPYVYAGVGYGERTIELDVIPILLTFERSKSDVVWHAGAGLDVRVAEHVKAGLRYEYFDGPDFDQTIGPVNFGADGDNHSVSAVLTFALN